MKGYVLDSAPENMSTELALWTDGQAGVWNGYPAPWATFDAVESFMGRWQANDPNGEWCPPHLSEDGELVTFDECAPHPIAGMARDGEPLYDMGGWQWVELTPEN